MTFKSGTRYALVTAAIVLASAIEMIRGYRTAVVVLSGLMFLLIGNGVVFASGSKERALRKRQKRDYYAGLR